MQKETDGFKGRHSSRSPADPTSMSARQSFPENLCSLRSVKGIMRHLVTSCTLARSKKIHKNPHSPEKIHTFNFPFRDLTFQEIIKFWR